MEKLPTRSRTPTAALACACSRVARSRLCGHQGVRLALSGSCFLQLPVVNRRCDHSMPDGRAIFAGAKIPFPISASSPSHTEPLTLPKARRRRKLMAGNTTNTYAQRGCVCARRYNAHGYKTGHPSLPFFPKVIGPHTSAGLSSLSL